jgi:CheY-like chemotaxis protein
MKRVVVVDDKKVEFDLISKAIRKISYEVELIYFSKAEEALNFLKSTSKEVFIILSDLNMPQMNGLELKQLIDLNPELKKKSIPFVFFSSVITLEDIEKAYENSIQGYFYKPNEVNQLVQVLDLIFTYWDKCYHPNLLNLKKNNL